MFSIIVKKSIIRIFKGYKFSKKETFHTEKERGEKLYFWRAWISLGFAFCLLSNIVETLYFTIRLVIIFSSVLWLFCLLIYMNKFIIFDAFCEADFFVVCLSRSFKSQKNNLRGKSICNEIALPALFRL